MFDSKFSFTILLLMFFALFSKVSTNILTIYELPKIYNKIPKFWQTLNNNHLLGQFYAPILSGFWTILLLTLLKMLPWRQRTLGTKLKKNLGRIFFKKMKYEKSPFLLHQMLSLFSTINLIFVLETNILGRTYSNLNNIFKDFNIQYLCKVYCNELEQYLMQSDAIEKKCNGTTNLSI